MIIKNDYRIIITGNNGVGKTSLLNLIYESLISKSYSTLFLHQKIPQKKRKDVLKEVINLTKEEQGEVFSVVYRLGSSPKAILNSAIPSPGETKKLLYGLAMLERVPLLLLDESTNYLDVLAIRALSDALKEFEGAIVKAFVSSIGNKWWNLERSKKSVKLTEELKIIF